MRHTVALAVFTIFLAGCERPSAPKTNFSGDAALGYVRTTMQFGPRIPGTTMAKQTGDWIEARMRERADTVIVQQWNHVTHDGKSLPLRNVFAQFRPALTDRVLYITHWDTRPISDEATNMAERQMPMPGANDGASGVGLFIALGDVLKKTPPLVGVDLLFVDGEDYGDFNAMTDVLIGSEYFASNPLIPKYQPLYGVLWDMIGDKDLGIKKEPNSVSAAPDVVSKVWQAAADMGYRKYFLDEEFGYPITDDHIPFLKAGYHVIDVIDLDYPYHHRPSDTMDKISAESLKIVGDVATALVTRQ